MEEDIKTVSHVGGVPCIILTRVCVVFDEALLSKQDVQTIADTTFRLLRWVISEAVTSLVNPEVKQGLGPGGGEHWGLLGQVVITLRSWHLSSALLTAVTPVIKIEAAGGEWIVVFICPEEKAYKLITVLSWTNGKMLSFSPSKFTWCNNS